MEKLADIGKFESLMNRANRMMGSDMVFNDGGEWKSDGWHSYNEVPPVVPDDGWNDLRRSDPETFVACGMKSPDDGKNWLRLANPEKYRMEEASNEFKKLRRMKSDEVDPEQMKRVVEDILSSDAHGVTAYTTKAQDEVARAQKVYDAADKKKKKEMEKEFIGKLSDEERDIYKTMGEERPEIRSDDSFDSWYDRFRDATEEPEEETEIGPDMKPLPIDVELEQDWDGLTEEEINERLAKASKESGLMDADHIMSKL